MARKTSNTVRKALSIDFRARLLIVIILCLAVSSILRIWFSAPAAGGIGFFAVLLVSYSLLKEVHLSFAAWILLAIISGVIIFVLGGVPFIRY
jgi:hypothetical protein